MRSVIRAIIWELKFQHITDDDRFCNVQHMTCFWLLPLRYCMPTNQVSTYVYINIYVRCPSSHLGLTLIVPHLDK